MKYYVLLIINHHFQMIYLDWLLDNLVQNLSHIHSDVGIVNCIGSFWRLLIPNIFIRCYNFFFVLLE